MEELRAIRESEMSIKYLKTVKGAIVGSGVHVITGGFL